MKQNKNNQSKSFKEVLVEIESPQDWGNGSWSLPENATSLEKSKYEICKQILIYKQDNNLPTEEIAKSINLTNLSLSHWLLYFG